MERPVKFSTIELIENYIDALNTYIDYLESNKVKIKPENNITFEQFAENNRITITAKGFIEGGVFNPNIDSLKERYKKEINT